MRVLGIFLLLAMASVSSAAEPDCSHHVPFATLEVQKVHLSVTRIFWSTDESGHREEQFEEVCWTESPLSIDVVDIRERERDWFYCHDRGVEFACDTRFQNRPARIFVRPAVVLRSWRDGSGRDTHFHAFLLPENDPTRYHDLFIRSLTPDLRKKEISLGGASGGRGENSGVDSYVVTAEFLP